MKLLELTEKIVSPWDLVFAGVPYIGGFVIGVLVSPAGIAPGEIAALAATGGVAVKQVLWRMTARRRAWKRAERLRALLAGGQAGNHVLAGKVDREIDLLRAQVIDADDATKSINALITEYRASNLSKAGSQPALPEAVSPVAIGQLTSKATTPPEDKSELPSP